MQVQTLTARGTYTLAHAFEMNSALTLALAVCAVAGSNGNPIPEVRTHPTLNTVFLHSQQLACAPVVFSRLRDACEVTCSCSRYIPPDSILLCPVPGS